MGQPRAFIAELATRLEAAREAEAQWALERKGPGRSRYQQILTEARQLRRELLTAARYHLRHNRSARARVASVGRRKDVATLVQDLYSLGDLLRSKSDAFAADTTLDPEQAASRAERAAQALSRALSEVRDNRLAIAALSTRNRAFTLLSASVRELRAAGRYAFRHDPDRRRRFASHYRRRNRRGAGSRRAQTPHPPDPGRPLPGYDIGVTVREPQEQGPAVLRRAVYPCVGSAAPDEPATGICRANPAQGVARVIRTPPCHHLTGADPPVAEIEAPVGDTSPQIQRAR